MGARTAGVATSERGEGARRRGPGSPGLSGRDGRPAISPSCCRVSLGVEGIGPLTARGDRGSGWGLAELGSARVLAALKTQLWRSSREGKNECRKTKRRSNRLDGPAAACGGGESTRCWLRYCSLSLAAAPLSLSFAQRREPPEEPSAERPQMKPVRPSSSAARRSDTSQPRNLQPAQPPRRRSCRPTSDLRRGRARSQAPWQSCGTRKRTRHLRPHLQPLRLGRSRSATADTLEAADDCRTSSALPLQKCGAQRWRVPWTTAAR